MVATRRDDQICRSVLYFLIAGRIIFELNASDLLLHWRTIKQIGVKWDYMISWISVTSLKCSRVVVYRLDSFESWPADEKDHVEVMTFDTVPDAAFIIVCVLFIELSGLY
ncbi:hypothetical protein AVEN_263556-1 [Araneus ventricosus]|uniref:Uncharacterized protein n=1 Tax=Araneus ventricosus TaxID=182803 RepID=A0A4Y2S2W9_ARAVE|nr:hypothetical protein AVEN_263556-1 [Araneus ventricosus]